MASDAQCMNKRIGRLVCRYLSNETTLAQTAVFEEHMLNCIACDVTVLNWRRFTDAVKSAQGR